MTKTDMIKVRYINKFVKINDTYVGLLNKVVSCYEVDDGKGYVILNKDEGDKEIVIFIDEIVAIKTCEKLHILK